jgi:2-C-methyl-D-erythritol 4-phosphate cytidylyltransferase
MKVLAVILAGGYGDRFKSEIPKQFIKLAGKLVIEHTTDMFEGHPLVDEIYLVVHKDFHNYMEDIVQRNAYKKVKKVLIGGETRQESSKIGILACEKGDVGKVLIHDAVRPFISEKIITDIILALDEFPAACAAIQSADTIIKVTDKKIIEQIPPRTLLLRNQTPQGFQLDVIKKANTLADQEGFTDAVDDCALMLRYGLGDIRVVDGREDNIKITHPIDVYIADRLYQVRTQCLEPRSFKQLQANLQNKVLVVFGGTTGIGKSIGDLAGKLGVSVYSYGPEKDVRQYEIISETLKQVYTETKKIDFVINTAGILQMAFIELTETKLIAEQIAVNLMGAINVCKAAVGFLKDTSGHIVLFTSSSYTRGRAGYTPYSCAKAGLVNFVQGFSEEVSDYGIKVNAINPERTKTPMRTANFGNEDDNILLRPETVAMQSLNLLTTSITGAVVDVRKSEEQQILKTFGQDYKKLSRS